MRTRMLPLLYILHSSLNCQSSLSCTYIHHHHHRFTRRIQHRRPIRVIQCINVLLIEKQAVDLTKTTTLFDDSIHYVLRSITARPSSSRSRLTTT